MIRKSACHKIVFNQFLIWALFQNFPKKKYYSKEATTPIARSLKKHFKLTAHRILNQRQDGTNAAR
jgi:hypothetical protein